MEAHRVVIIYWSMPNSNGTPSEIQASSDTRFCREMQVCCYFLQWISAAEDV
jgi:hypothetical protein